MVIWNTSMSLRITPEQMVVVNQLRSPLDIAVGKLRQVKQLGLVDAYTQERQQDLETQLNLCIPKQWSKDYILQNQQKLLEQVDLCYPWPKASQLGSLNGQVLDFCGPKFITSFRLTVLIFALGFAVHFVLQQWEFEICPYLVSSEHQITNSTNALTIKRPGKFTENYHTFTLLDPSQHG